VTVAAPPTPPRAAPAKGTTLADALRRPRYEIFPLEGIEDAVSAHVPRDVKVTVTSSPSRGLDTTLAIAEKLQTRGYAVVPHIAARLVRDRAHATEVIERLRAIDVREVFVIAGDAPEQTGEFEGAAPFLAALGELRGHFTEIGISGYPESHHFISDETTIDAMFAKEPMATHIVSQICFDADVIATWVRRVRDRGTFLPIWVGVPGAVDNRRLLRISLKIGLGESARFLRGHTSWLRRLGLRRSFAPTKLLDALAPTFADPEARIAGLHVYTFNELERTEAWRRRQLERLSAAHAD
jgi:methylenetetrahydrofolate reductase (NADPH)